MMVVELSESARLFLVPSATQRGKRPKAYKRMVPSVSVPRMSVRLVHSKVTKASGEMGKITNLTISYLP